MFVSALRKYKRQSVYYSENYQPKTILKSEKISISKLAKNILIDNKFNGFKNTIKTANLFTTQ